MADAKIKLYPTNEILFKINVASGQTGPTGPIGLTPQLTVVDTITGAPNTDANVVLGGTAENPTLTFTIPQGRPFIVEVEYPTINDLENNTNPTPSSYEPNLFDLAIIVSDQGVEDLDNAKLFIRDGIGPFSGWSFVSDLSGATGPVREVRFRPETSILEWRANNGVDWIEGKDLALKFNFEVDENDELILTIQNPDEETETINLTATAEFGTGGLNQPTVTSVKFINNNNTETSFQELGVYANFSGTELTLTNPDTTTVQQELALSFNWDGTTLQIKNPSELNYDSNNEQKLSPDIDFRNESNGVELSIVQPDTTPIYNKISPDINFRNEGNGVELSIVEPGAIVDYNKISPDIYFDGTSIAIMEPGVAPAPEDYINIKGDTGNVANEGSSLFRIRDENDDVAAGFLVTVDSEIQVQGSAGVQVTRSNGLYTVTLTEIDGGEFPEPE